MPLDRADAILDLSDPNVVLGPRKRRLTERVLENGDPLAHKKARKVSAAVTVSSNAPSHMESPTSSSMLPPTRLTITAPQSIRPTRPALAARPSSMHAAESGDGGTSDGAQAIVVEDSDDSGEGSDEKEATDEDDDAELGT